MADSTSLLIKDVHLFDGETFIENGHVLVEKGLITQVGSGPIPSSTPAGISVVSRPNHTLTPGLIDAHIHADAGNLRALDQSLKFGVTTVLDQHNEEEFFVPLAKIANDPTQYGKCADFKYCAYAATIEGGWPANVILAHDKSEETRAQIQKWPKLRTVADVEPYIKQQKAHGAGWIKLMHETGDGLSFDTLHFPEEMRRAVIQQSHAHGLRVVAHALAFGATLDVLREGVDGLTHCFLDGPSSGSEELVSLYKQNGAHCNPTLAILGSLTSHGKALQECFSKDPLASQLGIPTERLEHHCRCLSMANEKSSLENAYTALQQLYKAGVPIVVGSDTAGPGLGTNYGLSYHQEMYLLSHKVNMSPVDVLKAATSVIADRFELKDRGRLQVGKLADLALFDGDLREHLRDEKTYCLPIRCVWRRGVVADTWKEEIA